jgi:hypothetical protein
MRGKCSWFWSEKLGFKTLFQTQSLSDEKGSENFRALANGGEELDLKKRHTNGTTYLGARICVRNQLDENSSVFD